MDIMAEVITWSVFGIVIAVALAFWLPGFFRAMNEAEWDVTPDFMRKE